MTLTYLTLQKGIGILKKGPTSEMAGPPSQVINEQPL